MLIAGIFHEDELSITNINLRNIKAPKVIEINACMAQTTLMAGDCSTPL